MSHRAKKREFAVGMWLVVWRTAKSLDRQWKYSEIHKYNDLTRLFC